MFNLLYDMGKNRWILLEYCAQYFYSKHEENQLYEHCGIMNITLSHTAQLLEFGSVERNMNVILFKDTY